MSICKVNDYKLQTYQPDKIVKRATTVEFTANSPILYIHCYGLAFLISCLCILIVIKSLPISIKANKIVKIRIFSDSVILLIHKRKLNEKYANKSLKGNSMYDKIYPIRLLKISNNPVVKTSPQKIIPNTFKKCKTISPFINFTIKVITFSIFIKSRIPKKIIHFLFTLFVFEKVYYPPAIYQSCQYCDEKKKSVELVKFDS